MTRTRWDDDNHDIPKWHSTAGLLAVLDEWREAREWPRDDPELTEWARHRWPEWFKARNKRKRDY